MLRRRRRHWIEATVDEPRVLSRPRCGGRMIAIKIFERGYTGP